MANISGVCLRREVITEMTFGEGDASKFAACPKVIWSSRYKASTQLLRSEINGPEYFGSRLFDPFGFKSRALYEVFAYHDKFVVWEDSNLFRPLCVKPGDQMLFGVDDSFLITALLLLTKSDMPRVACSFRTWIYSQYQDSHAVSFSTLPLVALPVISTGRSSNFALS